MGFLFPYSFYFIFPYPGRLDKVLFWNQIADDGIFSDFKILRSSKSEDGFNCLSMCFLPLYLKNKLQDVKIWSSMLRCRMHLDTNYMRAFSRAVRIEILQEFTNYLECIIVCEENVLLKHFNIFRL